jgi:integrase
LYRFGTAKEASHMPRLVKQLPSFRLHKASGQAVVTLGGKDIYLGPHGTKASRAEYDRVVAEWLANGRRPTTNAADRSAPLTVSAMILRCWVYAKQHYRRDGRPTRELDNIRDSLRPLKKLYGHTAAAQFGPLALKAVRRAMIDADLARTTINYRVSKVRRAFKWAAENELIAPEVYQGLMTVAGLLRGREGARETEPVKTVPEAHVAAVLPYVSNPVRAMIELQGLTGMRPGEVTVMRGMDIDRTGIVWIFRPHSHKTVHHGHERVIPLGPQAQAILRRWLGEDPAAFLFSPAAAVAARNSERRLSRETPMTPSQARRKPKRDPKRPPRPSYDKNTYAQSIARACKKAAVPHWHPNQLRHSAATRFRQHFGLETARQILGHRSTDTTAIYAETDLARVAQIMNEIG